MKRNGIETMDMWGVEVWPLWKRCWAYALSKLRGAAFTTLVIPLVMIPIFALMIGNFFMEYLEGQESLYYIGIMATMISIRPARAKLGIDALVDGLALPLAQTHRRQVDSAILVATYFVAVLLAVAASHLFLSPSMVEAVEMGCLITLPGILGQAVQVSFGLGNSIQKRPRRLVQIELFIWLPIVGVFLIIEHFLGALSLWTFLGILVALNVLILPLVFHYIGHLYNAGERVALGFSRQVEDVTPYRSFKSPSTRLYGDVVVGSFRTLGGALVYLVFALALVLTWLWATDPTDTLTDGMGALASALIPIFFGCVIPLFCLFQVLRVPLPLGRRGPLEFSVTEEVTAFFLGVETLLPVGVPELRRARMLAAFTRWGVALLASLPVLWKLGLLEQGIPYVLMLLAALLTLLGGPYRVRPDSRLALLRGIAWACLFVAVLLPSLHVGVVEGFLRMLPEAAKVPFYLDFWTIGRLLIILSLIATALVSRSERRAPSLG